jgi:hypothetical protein
MIDIARIQSRVLNRETHTPLGTFAILGRLCDRGGISRHPVAENVSPDVCTARARTLEIFED